MRSGTNPQMMVAVARQSMDRNGPCGNARCASSTSCPRGAPTDLSRDMRECHRRLVSGPPCGQASGRCWACAWSWAPRGSTPPSAADRASERWPGLPPSTGRLPEAHRACRCCRCLRSQLMGSGRWRSPLRCAAGCRYCTQWVYQRADAFDTAPTTRPSPITTVHGPASHAGERRARARRRPGPSVQLLQLRVPQSGDRKTGRRHAGPLHTIRLPLSRAATLHRWGTGFTSGPSPPNTPPPPLHPQPTTHNPQPSPPHHCAAPPPHQPIVPPLRHSQHQARFR